MTVDRGEREYVLKERRARRWGSIVPAWYLRLRLRLACQAIDRIERHLADEFGVAETAPLHAELEALFAERDALLKRLAARG
ncbi:MAG: hypothetical protein H7Y61_14220 [Rhizobiales bacterium]|nr:hypothetical protein [Rhizobacter sp.]